MGNIGSRYFGSEINKIIGAGMIVIHAILTGAIVPPKLGSTSQK